MIRINAEVSTLRLPEGRHARCDGIRQLRPPLSAAREKGDSKAALPRRTCRMCPTSYSFRYGSPETYEYDVQHPHKVDRTSLAGRVALTHAPVHIPDILADPEYIYWAAAWSRPSSTR